MLLDTLMMMISISPDESNMSENFLMKISRQYFEEEDSLDNKIHFEIMRMPISCIHEGFHPLKF